MSCTLDTTTQQNNVPAFDLAGQLCDRYKGRGIAKEIALDDMAFEKELQKTASQYPAAYSLWNADERTIDKKYRHEDADGNRYMDSDGFVRYFKDCRRLSAREEKNIYVNANYSKRAAVSSPVSELVSAKDKNALPSGTSAKIGYLFGEWISPDRERRASTTATARPGAHTWLSVVAVFISFMLIVASSIMVGVETGNVSEMRSELETLEDEKAELELELEIKNDLVSIYDVATNELGMISENSVAVKYLPESEPTTVKNYDEEDDGRLDLATILSAIGIRR